MIFKIIKIITPSSPPAAVPPTLLKKGGVVICPTDTVYGFLADASNKKAVEKIYNIKKRPKSKPLSLFVKDFKMASEIAVIDEKQAKILKKFWPGKYTFILKRKQMDVGRLSIYGVKKETIAIRIPNHPFLKKLLKKVNRPLVQTSVNISTQEPLNNREAILATFEKSKLVGLIIDDGNTRNAQPSKIVDLTARNLTRIR